MFHVIQAYFVVCRSALASINEVNPRPARLVLRWATVSGFNSRWRTLISVCNQPATQGQLSLPSLRGRWGFFVFPEFGVARPIIIIIIEFFYSGLSMKNTAKTTDKLGLIPPTPVATPHQKYIRYRVLGWAWNIDSDTSPTSPRIFTRDEKLQKWCRFWTPVQFKALWFQKESNLKETLGAQMMASLLPIFRLGRSC